MFAFRARHLRGVELGTIISICLPIATACLLVFGVPLAVFWLLGIPMNSRRRLSARAARGGPPSLRYDSPEMALLALLRRAPRGVVGAFVVVAVGASGCGAVPAPPAGDGGASAAVRLVLDQARLATAPPDLRRRLAASPLALFRFVNQEWTRGVCEAFAGDLEAMPTARLHGDAHVEQYAVTAAARGLDDFDDSARGPAVVDIVRFLGSLEVTARERGWMASLPAIVDAFFEGYRRALDDPAYLPPDPAVVTRLRSAPIKSPAGFLSWADSLMEPLTPREEAQVDAAWPTVVAYAAKVDPEATPSYLRRKRVGWLRLGIGSALSNKALFRLEGPSSAPDDDVVLEAKEVTALRGESCVSVPPGTEAFRIVEGLRQIGRLRHRLLVAMPALGAQRPDTFGWWVKSWEPSYRELEIADLASADELREVAHDVGAQLGSTNLAEPEGSVEEQKRRVERLGVARLEARMRQVAHELTLALLEAWEQVSGG